jgi:hypothetical protein
MFLKGDKVRLKPWVTEAHMNEIHMHLLECTLRVVEPVVPNDCYPGICSKVREESPTRLCWVIKHCYLELVP